MSSLSGSSRRPRRTPTTPSRYGKDFVVETNTSIKKEIKEKSTNANRFSKVSATSDDGRNDSPRTRSTPPSVKGDTGTTRVRRASKRLAKEEIIEHDELKVKQQKKTNTDLQKTPQSKKMTQLVGALSSVINKQKTPDPKKVKVHRAVEVNINETGAAGDVSKMKIVEPKNIEETANKTGDGREINKEMMASEPKKIAEPVDVTKNKTGDNITCISANDTEQTSESEANVNKRVAASNVKNATSQENQPIPGSAKTTEIAGSVASTIQPLSDQQIKSPTSNKLEAPSTRGLQGSSVNSGPEKPVTIKEPVKITPASSVYKALKEVLARNKSVAGISGSKDNPVKISLVESPTGNTYSVRLVSSSPHNKAVSEKPTTPQQKSTSGSPLRSKSISPSKTTTPDKRVVVDIITADQTKFTGHISELGQQRPENQMAIPIKISKVGISPTGHVAKPQMVTGNGVSSVKTKGKTTFTQTTLEDMKMCTRVNSVPGDVKVAYKVMKVSQGKVTKSCFRKDVKKQQVKHCQTVSRWTDTNFTILEAFGSRKENESNEYSLTYEGEDSSQVDKKIQLMLFGQELDMPIVKTQGGVPCNIIDDDAKSKTAKPSNAKISVESWSLALTVLNHDV